MTWKNYARPALPFGPAYIHFIVKGIHTAYKLWSVFRIFNFTNLALTKSQDFVCIKILDFVKVENCLNGSRLFFYFIFYFYHSKILHKNALFYDSLN